MANVTVKEALAGEEAQRWKEAMNEEYRGLMRLNSWDLVPRPRDAKLIPCHWILTTKKDHNGKVVRYKARLVAGGNFQREGIDFDETYAPVANQMVFRCLLAIAAYKNYKLYHLDVDNAYLNGDLDMTIYMRQPPHFVDQGRPYFVCKMKKALYGLKQSARCWWMEIDNTFKSMGFGRCEYLYGIYSAMVDGEAAFILLYVDNILVVCKN